MLRFLFTPLEVYLCPELHYPSVSVCRKRSDTEDLSEGGRACRGSIFVGKAWSGWVRKIRVVEGVKGFKAQFNVLRLVDVNLLLNRHVAVVDARAIERVAIGAANATAGSPNRKDRRAIREPEIARTAIAPIG